MGVRGTLRELPMGDETVKAVHPLRQAEDRYRALVECATDAIVSADARGRIVSWNGAAERMFGYRVDDVLGRPLTILMPEDRREAHERGLDRFSATGAARIMGRTVELEALRADGSTFPIELSLSTCGTDGDRVFTAIVRDITARR